MTWAIERVGVGEVKRRKVPPNYGIIEQSLNGGSAYVIKGDTGEGYFLVGAESSLAPNFVVELSLPELAVVDEYRGLAEKMAERSLGVIWFDSSDRDACDLVWRLGLSVRSGPPLFSSRGLEHDVDLDAFEVRFAEDRDRDTVIDLLTSAPLDAGGQTKDAVIENLEGRCIRVLTRGDEIIGASVLAPMPGKYVALTSVVMESYSPLKANEHEAAHRQLELVFMNKMAVELAERDLTLVYSMSLESPEGFLEAVALQMTHEKQRFLADFGTQDARPTLYGFAPTANGRGSIRRPRQ